MKSSCCRLDMLINRGGFVMLMIEVAMVISVVHDEDLAAEERPVGDDDDGIVAAPTGFLFPIPRSHLGSNLIYCLKSVKSWFRRSIYVIMDLSFVALAYQFLQSGLKLEVW
ncbi:hypothetical protein F0562_016934 [Nyssa sinensis]|uniref:Uncharacterized protein n=1 Tax=Nyssa sinensis TaxID=561372 RepID=A0A5J4ZDK9_9ASTE|nr:hypothetical protein F0562_016934 [Nyssa sinensis]